MTSWVKFRNIPTPSHSLIVSIRQEAQLNCLNFTPYLLFYPKFCHSLLLLHVQSAQLVIPKPASPRALSLSLSLSLRLNKFKFLGLTRLILCQRHFISYETHQQMNTIDLIRNISSFIWWKLTSRLLQNHFVSEKMSRVLLVRFLMSAKVSLAISWAAKSRFWFFSIVSCKWRTSSDDFTPKMARFHAFLHSKNFL